MLRFARETDNQTIATIWRAAWASANPHMDHLAPLEHWQTRVQAEFDAPNQTLVYEAESREVVAFMVMNTEDAYLHQIFVHPQWQRTGIGSRLLEHLCALCPAGWSLHVATKNSRALHFYARHGLTEGPVSCNPVTGRERLLYSWRPPL